MVRVGAKRERPCVVVLHAALRAAATPAPLARQSQQAGASASPLPPSPERYVWKSRHTAELYASAVLARVRAWWEMLGGLRYGLPDAVRLSSCVWDGDASTRPTTTTSTTPAVAEVSRQAKKEAARAGKRARRVSATQRRSGVLRCAVQLSRSLYGDAAALHIFRAACACVTEVHVSLPLTRLAAVEGNAEEKDGAERRRQRLEERGGSRLEQDCHAAVRVARVEHVVSSRRI